MDELLAKYSGKLKSFNLGEKVKGKVAALMPGRVIIDIGGKSEGIVAEKAYKESENFIKNLEIGDDIEGTVIVSETSEGYTVLSLRTSSQEAIWEEVKEASEKLKPVAVMGRMSTSSGIVADFKGVSGFVPKSQIGRELSKNPASLIGKKFEAVIIDFDRESNRIILSEKEVSEKEELAKARSAMDLIKVGDVYEGKISSIYDFGCFVKVPVSIGKGKEKEDIDVEGLVHISELSWDKVVSPNAQFKAGDKVKVKVIGKEKGKLALSIKQVAEDPWLKIAEKYSKDQKVKGKVSKVSDYGLLVSLEPGIDGLVHMTKIPPGEKYAKGDEVNVYIEEIDSKEKKISLGLVLTAKPLGYK